VEEEPGSALSPEQPIRKRGTAITTPPTRIRLSIREREVEVIATPVDAKTSALRRTRVPRASINCSGEEVFWPRSRIRRVVEEQYEDAWTQCNGPPRWALSRSGPSRAGRWSNFPALSPVPHYPVTHYEAVDRSLAFIRRKSDERIRTVHVGETRPGTWERHNRAHVRPWFSIVVDQLHILEDACLYLLPIHG